MTKEQAKAVKILCENELEFSSKKELCSIKIETYDNELFLVYLYVNNECITFIETENICSLNKIVSVVCRIKGWF